MIEKASCDQRVKHVVHMLIEESVVKDQQINDMAVMFNQLADNYITLVQVMGRMKDAERMRRELPDAKEQMNKKYSSVASEAIGEYEDED